ncbi:unnamed protein product [Rhizophagus irregularis]|nr:unnamed protein product [Rhizophagus irregularis]
MDLIVTVKTSLKHIRAAASVLGGIQNIPNTDNGIEIKKQAEFQMKEFFRSPTNVLGKNKLNVKRRKDDNDIIENALKESTQI